MKEINVYELKPSIKDGIMKTMYTMNGLLNEVDFGMLNGETVDMYLEGCIEMCSLKYKTHKREKLYCGMIFEGKEFRGWIYNKDQFELMKTLKEYTDDFQRPKFWIGEV